MKKIYLIRHGQTAANNGKRFQGSLDYPLDGVGLAQAAQLGEYFQNLHLDAIYSSNMLRARMTAAAIAMAKNMAYRTVDDLREASFGLWEGLSFDEIQSRWPEKMDMFFTRPGEWEPPQGESFQAVQSRALGALQQVLDRTEEGQTVAIVAHGGIIRVQLCHILGMPLNNMWRLSSHNVSVTSLSEWDGNFIVNTINDYHFLK